MGSWQKIGCSVALLGLLAVAEALRHHAWGAAVILGCVMAGVIWHVYRELTPYERVARAFEGLAAGDLSQPRLTLNVGGEVGRMATAFNQLLTQLDLLSEEATELANGYIGVQGLQERVLESGQLSAVDLPSNANQGDLNRSFAKLTNQLRRLTVKAHIIGNDQLFNPALDEELPGELGEAFGMMVGNLRTLARRADQIAGGDLTSTVDGDGDLTSAFNTMVNGVGALVEEIMQSAMRVASSTEEMLQVLQNHESSARHQAERIDNAQQTVQDLLESADVIADSAQQVFQTAEDTRDQNRQIGRRIDQLNQLSTRITEILDLIRNIADRSDLLALNASLEGARAGNSGNGFGLVAQEMRRLAENTKDSVGSIKALVDDIQAATRSTSNACREGLNRSEETTEAALNIKLVTREQRENTDALNQAMEDVSGSVTRSVAGIRQVGAAASELATLSESLRTLVDHFEVDQTTELSAVPTPPRPASQDVG